VKSLIAAAMLAVLGGAVSAEPLEGMWRTAPDDNGNSGLVQVQPCGDALCGTLVQAFGPSGEEIASPNLGRQIIWDTRPQGDGSYRGRVYSPDRDQEYNSRLILSGDSLSVSGCFLGICREGGTWARMP
jgi:uncharacterized protein (DUF2147 family)